MLTVPTSLHWLRADPTPLLCCLDCHALQLQQPTNVASIVVHQALAKSLDRFNTAMSAQPARLLQQQQATSPGGRQRPGAAYEVQDSPSELTYDELAVSQW